MSRVDPDVVRGALTTYRRTGNLTETGAPLPTDTREVVQLLASREFLDAVDNLAGQLERPSAEVLAEAGGYLREMSARHSERVTDAWMRLSGWLSRGYDVLVDDDSLAQLRRLDRKHSLILLISHRSYLDEFVLPPALTAGGLSNVYGLAGANLNFFPLGNVARLTGIVHVRRATGDVPVYRLALRSFVAQLVRNKANLIWSIEGGRSRTGKLRPPRHGLLRYVVDAVESTDQAETLLVPVSIQYDQLPVHEVGRMASEARGSSKQPEDARWMINYARGLRARLGRVYLDFGTPVPLRERLEELQAEGVDDRGRVERVALDVSHRINAATPVTPTAAVCVALLAEDRALTLDEVLATVEPLARYLAKRGWPVAGAANLTDRSTVRRALQELDRSGVLTCYAGGPETVWGVGTDQHLVAAVYRNSAVHVLLVRAIAELSLLAVSHDHDRPENPATEVALRLRELLKFDFFFAGRERFLEEVQAEVALLAEPDRAPTGEVSPAEAREWLARARPLVAHLVLRPFLDAYRVVAEQLAAMDEDEEFEEPQFVDGCLRLGHQWALQRKLASEESVSGEMFGTALKLAKHRDLVTSDAEYLAKRRRAFADEIREVGHNIAEIAALP